MTGAAGHRRRLERGICRSGTRTSRRSRSDRRSDMTRPGWRCDGGDVSGVSTGVRAARDPRRRGAVGGAGGHGGLPDLLRAGGQDRHEPGGGAAALVLVPGGAPGVRGDRRQGSELRDGALGRGAHLLGQPVRRAADARDDRHRQGRDREGPGHRHADPAREGLHRRRRRPVLERRRHHPARSRRRLRADDGPDRQGQPWRHRGPHLLGALGGPDRHAHRQDLRRQPARRRDPRAAVQEDAGSSRAGALHHPRLRRAAAGAARARRGAPLRVDRAGRCRTRSTCRRTPSRASATGRSRSTPTASRRRPPARPAARPAPARSCTPSTTRPMPTCSWPTTPRPRACATTR